MTLTVLTEPFNYNLTQPNFVFSIQIGEEEKKEKKIVWDGHTASMEKVTQKARENISIEDQIAVIHKVKGLV